MSVERGRAFQREVTALLMADLKVAHLTTTAAVRSAVITSLFSLTNEQHVVAVSGYPAMEGQFDVEIAGPILFERISLCSSDPKAPTTT